MTGIKALKAGGTESGASLKEPEVEKVLVEKVNKPRNAEITEKMIS